MTRPRSGVREGGEDGTGFGEKALAGRWARECGTVGRQVWGPAQLCALGQAACAGNLGLLYKEESPNFAFLGLEAPPLSSGAPRTPTSEHYGEER